MADPTNPFDQFDSDPGRPVIRKGVTPTPPQEAYHPALPQEKQSFGIPQNVPVAVSGSGKPEVISLPSDKDKGAHWRPIVPSDGTLYNANRPGIIQDTGNNVGDVKYGPESATQQGQAFKVGDTDEINHAFGIMDNLNAARKAAQQPLSAGTWAGEVANLPVVGGALGQNRSNLMTSLGAVSGDLRQLGIQRLYQITGQKGVGTMARSNAEQAALQNSMAALGYDPTTLKPNGAQPDGETLGHGMDQAQGLYERHIARLFNMDPDNPTAIQIVKAAESSPANRQALVEAYKANGGTIGQLRLVTKADGHPIPPIILPKDASDDDVRNAVRGRGYNVAPNTKVLTGMAPGAGNTPPPDGGGGTPPTVGPGSAYSALNDAEGNGTLFGLGDPIQAASATAINGHSFDQNLAAIKAHNNAEYAAHPVAGWAGTIASLIPQALGGLATGGEKAAATGISKLLEWLGGNGSLAKAAVRSPVVAAPIGAVEGAANAGEGNRVSGAAKGAALATAVAPLAVPLAAAGGKSVGWIGSHVFPEVSAAQAFQRIAPEATPEGMAAEAARLRAAGVEPAPLDTLNNASLDQVRNVVGGRSGSKAATILNDEAAARASAAPARLTAQARSAVGPAPAVASEVPLAAAPTELRQNLSTAAGEQFAKDFAPIADKRVPLTGDMLGQLARPQGLEIVRQARKLPLSDNAERELAALPGQLGQSLDMNKWLEGFGPKAVEQIRAQMGQKPTDLSLEALNALRQVSYHKNGGSIPGMDKAISAFHSAAREAGVSAVPQYGPLLERYSTQAGVASHNGEDAISLGEKVLNGNPEEMSMAARGLPPMDNKVAFPQVAVSPRQAAGEGVVRSVEQAASTPRGAVNLGRQMTTPEQQARNRIAMTPEQSAKLEQGLSNEASRIASAERAAPSSAPDSDSGGAVVGAATGLLYHSAALKGAKLAGLLNKAKISADQADRIARKLVTPAEMNGMIQNLQRAGYAKDRAKQLYQMLAYQLSTSAARGATGKKP